MIRRKYSFHGLEFNGLSHYWYDFTGDLELVENFVNDWKFISHVCVLYDKQLISAKEFNDFSESFQDTCDTFDIGEKTNITDYDEWEIYKNGKLYASSKD